MTTDPSGAEILINDLRVGTSPYSATLLSGEHQMTIRKELYYTSAISFKLEAGGNTNLNELLKPRFAYMTIETTPKKALVYIDGKSLGRIPVKQTRLEWKRSRQTKSHQ